MKNLKKHIHGIAGAALFLFCGLVVLFLSGFTIKLPLPVEKAVIIDFSNKDVNRSNYEIVENIVQDSKDNMSTENRIMVKSLENAEISESDMIELVPNTGKIDELFTNSFSNGDDNNRNNSLTGDFENGPDKIAGKLDDRKRITFVEPQSKANLFGRVVFQITVNEKGNVVEIKLIDTNCNDCVQPAKDAINKWKYESLPGSGLQSGLVVIEFIQE